MKFVDEQIFPFKRRSFCDSCGKELIATGKSITRWKTEVEHRCACDDPVWLTDVTYPCVIYKDRTNNDTGRD